MQAIERSRQANAATAITATAGTSEHRSSDRDGLQALKAITQHHYSAPRQLSCNGGPEH